MDREEEEEEAEANEPAWMAVCEIFKRRRAEALQDKGEW